MKNLSGVGVILFFLALAASARGNPYLAKPGEIPLTVRVAACAITGGFIHLYTALDYGLFDKYGMKVEFVSIRGSGAPGARTGWRSGRCARGACTMRGIGLGLGRGRAGVSGSAALKSKPRHQPPLVFAPAEQRNYRK